jgi:hypothetical protein
MCTVCPKLCRELWIWLTTKLTAQADGRDGPCRQHAQRAADAVCVLCAVSIVNLLTAKSDPRSVLFVCRESGRPAHGRQTWHRVC